MRRLRIALAFLTRLPAGVDDASEVEVGRSLAFFPVVGALLGLALAGAATLLAGRLPDPVLAVALVGLLAALTGGLHVDGLADTFDALGASGADRARRLEILRDSRIGAHGATALVLVLLGKVAAVETVVTADALATLVAVPAVGRWAAALLLLRHPYARASGLGSAFRSHARPADAAVATLVTLAAVAWLGGGAWLAALGALAVVATLGALAARRFGGLTGDVYGAAIEIGELVFLVLMVAS